jgi:TonB-linked SusC/RagA family outer membrane protein
VIVAFAAASLFPAAGQQLTVTGSITDENSDPMPGVNVRVKGTTSGVVSNVEGRFSISVPGEDAVLAFSFVGYVPQEITVGSQRTLNVNMAEDTRQIDEVVVTGYGTIRKESLTGSISTLSNKELTVTKNENVVNALAGKMPGLRISQRTSQPGAYNTVIDVRGYGEPLFVVDGVPRDKDYFSRMDPEEIESISLLKDASAAIYGIRASNGVMLITTKKGTAQDGKVDITYSGNFSLQQMLYIPDSYTTVEWMTLRNEQHYKGLTDNYWGHQNPLHSQEEIAEAAGLPIYNWQKEVFRTFTPQTRHNLMVDGGSEKLRYFVNLGYQLQDGCYASGSLWADRWNFRSNIDAQITKRFSTSISIGAVLGNTWEPNGSMWDVYKAAFLQVPGAPFYANDNPLYLNGYSQYNAEFTNLLGKTDADYVGYVHKKERRLNGSLTLNYEIPGVKGLAIRGFYDYFMNVPDEMRYKKAYTTYSYDPDTKTYNEVKTENAPSSTSRRSDISIGTDMQLQVIYGNRFGQHSVNGTLVYEEAYSSWDNFTAMRNLVLNSEYLFAGESDGQSASGGAPGDRSQRAFITKLNYDYAGKYMVEFIARYEASSRWPKESRWGFFPSVSAGWRISEEGFVKNNLDFVSNIKLRASYGQMGDENVGNFNYPQVFVGYETHNSMGWLFADGKPTAGIRPTAIPNPNLTWLKTEMKNLALDFGFFRDKISGSIELFQRDRSGLLATSSAVIPGTVGASLPQENMNDDRSSGWELTLTHHNRISDVDYFVTGQISSTRRKWLYRMEEPASNSYDHWRNRYSGRYHNDDFWWGNESEYMFTSLEEIRNYQGAPQGQATLPGDWSALDWNGDGVVNGQDEHPIGTRGLPYFNYGISLGASYKNFDLSAHFQGVYKVYTQLSEIFVEALPFGGQNSLNWFLDRWHPADPNADYFSTDTEWISGYYPLTGGDGRRSNSNGVMNASYFRLKTLEIGYTLPGKLLEKIKMKSLRVYLSGYNLLTFTPLKNIDPERPSSTERAGGSVGGADQMYVYPNNKTYTVGLSVKF